MYLVQETVGLTYQVDGVLCGVGDKYYKILRIRKAAQKFVEDFIGVLKNVTNQIATVDDIRRTGFGSFYQKLFEVDVVIYYDIMFLCYQGIFLQ